MKKKTQHQQQLQKVVIVLKHRQSAKYTMARCKLIELNKIKFKWIIERIVLDMSTMDRDGTH